MGVSEDLFCEEILNISKIRIEKLFYYNEPCGIQGINASSNYKIITFCLLDFNFVFKSQKQETYVWTQGSIPVYWFLSCSEEL